jgi:hypothetical protein
MLGLKVAAIAGVVAWAVGTAGGAYVGYRWELGAYQPT